MATKKIVPNYENTRTWYNEKYGSGQGWVYHHDRELATIQNRILGPIVLPAGAALDVLDLGCGEGFHASLFHELGHRATGVDLSDVGISNATAAHPGPTFVAANAVDWLPEHVGEFDLVFSRGCSWWHYELSGTNHHGFDVAALTAAVFAALRPGGVFVLQAGTDFTGKGKGGANKLIHNNKLSAYRKLFEKYGEIVSVTDWAGTPLGTGEAPEGTKGGIIIHTMKVA